MIDQLTTEQARDIKLGVELVASVNQQFVQLLTKWQLNGSWGGMARVNLRTPRWQAELARRRERKARR